jgi:hypothetical protein
MRNLVFQDTDEQLDLEECVRRISMTLQEISGRPTHEQ